MPRPKVDEPRDKTLLLRVTERQREVLESIAHLESVSPNEYVHQLLIHDLAVQAKHPRVQADIENRQAYKRERDGAIMRIRKG